MAKIRIYLDNCCFNRPYDNQEQISIRLESEAKLELQSRVKRGVILLAWSFMLDYENSLNIESEKKKNIYEWQKFAESYFIGSDKTRVIAGALADKGFSIKDAVHIACAIESNCDYFITTDKDICRLKNKVTELKIVSPIEYFSETGDKNEK